jgi:O-glycosyl hydrolase/fibronectin type 3 domain-containing protein
MISSWSPPGYLKSNGSANNGGTLKKDPNGDFMYDEFAQWWYDSLNYYAGVGVIADYINIQNEPNYVDTWETCLFDPVESSTCAGYNIAFETVWQKLNTEMGPDMPKMLAAEARSIWLTPDYLDNLIEPSHVYGYTHHLYGDVFSGYLDYSVPDMYLLNVNYGDKPLMQTEFSKGDDVTSFNEAMDLAVIMHNSLVAEEVSVYLYWELFWDGHKGLVSITSSTYTINPVYYAFKQFAYFTDPNWQRIDATVTDPRLRISAFISPDNQQISSIIINTRSNSFDVNLPITGFSMGAGEYYRTSPIEHCELIGTYDGTGPLTFPGNSITTVVVWSDDPPSPPTGLEAAPGNFQVSIDWSDNTETDIDGYNIYRSQTSGSDYVKLNTSLIDSSDYIDTDVNVAQTYYYVATAVDKCSVESAYSLEDSAVPFDINPPSAPTGLISQAGNSTVSLDWLDNVEEDVNGYNVYRSTTSGSGYVKLNDTLVSTSDYIDDTVSNQTTYYYVVTAVDIYSNESGCSSEVPATPSSVAPTVYNFNGITASDTEYNAFACDVDTFPFGGSSANMNSKTEATDQEYINISANNTAEWATADAGFFDQIFLWVEMKINETPGDIDRIDLTFSGNTSGTADVIHQIYVMKAGTDWTQNSSWVQVGSDMSISPGADTTMTRSITSDFGTYIDDTDGKLIWAVYETTSSEVMHINYLETSVTGSGDTEPPAAPTGLVATAGNDLVSLDWDDNSETDLAGYNVYRSQTSGSSYNKINSSLLVDSNYVDNDVDNFTTYYYVVTAVDTNNNGSGYSNESSATPDIYQNCAEVQAGGDGLVSDLTGDCYVNLEDLEVVSTYWLDVNCVESGNCGGADFEPVDGDVDLQDFSDFGVDWMLCNNPVDSACIKNWWP